ncbi:hypothetical protein OEG92_08915 [Polaribacter sejongensis]|uniref:hypothetical protein n=1 Tax=Polaribacter sejongensis TaxID=985043 RepID=UPI0035A6E434
MKIYSSFQTDIFLQYFIVFWRIVDFSLVEELSTFRLLNSRLQGHPTTHEGLPGVRIASGSLGQGMSNALGARTSKKVKWRR